MNHVEEYRVRTDSGELVSFLLPARADESLWVSHHADRFPDLFQRSSTVGGDIANLASALGCDVSYAAALHALHAVGSSSVPARIERAGFRHSFGG